MCIFTHIEWDPPTGRSCGLLSCRLEMWCVFGPSCRIRPQLGWSGNLRVLQKRILLERIIGEARNSGSVFQPGCEMIPSRRSDSGCRRTPEGRAASSFLLWNKQWSLCMDTQCPLFSSQRYRWEKWRRKVVLRISFQYLLLLLLLSSSSCWDPAGHQHTGFL